MSHEFQNILMSMTNMSMDEKMVEMSQEELFSYLYLYLDENQKCELFINAFMDEHMYICDCIHEDRDMSDRIASYCVYSYCELSPLQSEWVIRMTGKTPQEHYQDYLDNEEYMGDESNNMMEPVYITPTASTTDLLKNYLEA